MIPYDDLVIALQAWRARQGLPVAQLSGALTPPPPPRTAPATPPPRGGFAANVVTPPPLAPADEPINVDEAALIEEAHYENEGDDFAMAFNNLQQEGESTSIGMPPPPRDSFGSPTDPDPDVPGTKRGGNDW